MEVREGLFDKIRAAMKGQDNSIFETSEGRVLAYMNPAGNLIVERCYGEHQSLSVEPNDETEDWMGNWGNFDFEHGIDEPDTIEPWWPQQRDIEALLRQLASVEPVAFIPPGEVDGHKLWLPLDVCQASRAEIAVLYQELWMKLGSADKRWLFSSESDGLRFGAAVDDDAHILICYHAVCKSVPQFTFSVYPDGAIAACFYSGGSEFPVYELRRNVFETLCQRLRTVEFSVEEPLTASTSIVHTIVDATDPENLTVCDLSPGTYVLEQIPNPLGHEEPWLVIIGTKQGQAGGTWRKWAGHTDESRIIFSR